ncbi:hypothetical protein MSAN_01797600 [Mycena sanguinolenta]|uniref:General transcription and DNA repair factor IIH subunit TFB5 n=1 Tax=Mycena sanguinolenta TaxID=230812 RepID=A0A8H7CU91_9AGAR|nr:hypothetical protein MSAN_01797600 [Mycena sanguinolenta]
MDLFGSSRPHLESHIFALNPDNPPLSRSMRAIKTFFLHGSRQLLGRNAALGLDVPNSDPAVKEILIAMNGKENFIIEDLDDYHLVTSRLMSIAFDAKLGSRVGEEHL